MKYPTRPPWFYEREKPKPKAKVIPIKRPK